MLNSELFKEIADQQGWTLATQICVLLEFIDQEANDIDFDIFLENKVLFSGLVSIRQKMMRLM